MNHTITRHGPYIEVEATRYRSDEPERANPRFIDLRRALGSRSDRDVALVIMQEGVADIHFPETNPRDALLLAMQLTDLIRDVIIDEAQALNVTNVTNVSFAAVDPEIAELQDQLDLANRTIARMKYEGHLYLGLPAVDGGARPLKVSNADGVGRTVVPDIRQLDLSSLETRGDGDEMTVVAVENCGVVSKAHVVYHGPRVLAQRCFLELSVLLDALQAAR